MLLVLLIVVLLVLVLGGGFGYGDGRYRTPGGLVGLVLVVLLIWLLVSGRV